MVFICARPIAHYVRACCFYFSQPTDCLAVGNYWFGTNIDFGTNIHDLCVARNVQRKMRIPFDIFPVEMAMQCFRRSDFDSAIRIKAKRLNYNSRQKVIHWLRPSGNAIALQTPNRSISKANKNAYVVLNSMQTIYNSFFIEIQFHSNWTDADCILNRTSLLLSLFRIRLSFPFYCASHVQFSRVYASICTIFRLELIWVWMYMCLCVEAERNGIEYNNGFHIVISPCNKQTTQQHIGIMLHTKRIHAKVLDRLTGKKIHIHESNAMSHTHSAHYTLPSEYNKDSCKW